MTAENPKKMNEIFNIIYRVAMNIGYKFNPNKCKTLSFFSG